MLPKTCVGIYDLRLSSITESHVKLFGEVFQNGQNSYLGSASERHHFKGSSPNFASNNK